MGLPRRAWVKRIVFGKETNGLSGKRNVLSVAVIKEGHHNSF